MLAGEHKPGRLAGATLLDTCKKREHLTQLSASTFVYCDPPASADRPLAQAKVPDQDTASGQGVLEPMGKDVLVRRLKGRS